MGMDAALTGAHCEGMTPGTPGLDAPHVGPDSATALPLPLPIPRQRGHDGLVPSRARELPPSAPHVHHRKRGRLRRALRELATPTYRGAGRWPLA